MVLPLGRSTGGLLPASDLRIERSMLRVFRSRGQRQKRRVVLLVPRDHDIEIDVRRRKEGALGTT